VKREGVKREKNREGVKRERRNRAVEQKSSRAVECSRRSESLRIFATIKVAATKTKTTHTSYRTHMLYAICSK